MAYRKEKLEEQIKRIISELLIREIKDPRIGFATITGVELSKDHSVAKVGVSVLGDPRELRKTMEGLTSALPYIQHRMVKALGIRVIPKISFFLDSSIVDGVNMVNLLDKLEESESRGHADGKNDETGQDEDGEQE